MSLDDSEVDNYRAAQLPDGRKVEYLLEGDPEGFPLVFHHGTPGAAVPYAYLSETARDHGLALVVPSRPGYGTSAPHPGRRIADVAVDIACVLDDLGCDQFVSLGWSGGGPHALACAALHPTRCYAVAVGASLAPFGADDLDFFAGMGRANIVEHTAAVAGQEALLPLLEEEAMKFAAASVEEVAETLGDIASPADKAYATGDFASRLLASIKRGLTQGLEGWVEDALAFVHPWGFNLEDIRVPVSVWHGYADWTVPPAHGEWLAEHVAGAAPHLYQDEGHLSLWNQIDVILDDLVQEGGL